MYVNPNLISTVDVWGISYSYEDQLKERNQNRDLFGFTLAILYITCIP